MMDAGKREDPLGELMRRSQGGDAAAYAELLKEAAGVVRRVIRGRRTSLNDEDVEDLIQETLLALHNVRATFDPARPFMPWLLAIARNRFVDRARRYFRKDAREVPIDEQNVTSALPDTNTMVDTFGEYQALHRAIQELPSGQREAIEMLKLREMSLKEASEASGITIGALKVATHRAMNSLRKLLEKR
jgi:RNA polymerase sigma-70 factor (ECF subfamily)